ncbi:MAG: large subunit ribosomal protein [Thermoplasmata archaeon]|jgi:large subunit ribosomal protein L5|nr:large subunit ribosomal protein [Thermoplasmata archaeon]
MAATANPMLKPRIIKVVVNIGVGEGGDKLQKAEKVLEMVTQAKPARTLSKVTNRDWNLRLGAPIGVRTTLRGEAASAFLRKALDIRQFKVPDYSFDDGGNLNLGIPDYTDFPGMKYDPEIGIFGMNVAVVIERPGGRVARRRLESRKVARHHKVSREEAMDLMREQFNVEVI